MWTFNLPNLAARLELMPFRTVMGESMEESAGVAFGFGRECPFFANGSVLLFLGVICSSSVIKLRIFLICCLRCRLSSNAYPISGSFLKRLRMAGSVMLHSFCAVH